MIDIIEDPSEVIKLYTFPLLRESEYWKKNQNNDLPPPPMERMVISQIKRKSKISLKGFVEVAKPGDAIYIQIGNPNGSLVESIVVLH